MLLVRPSWHLGSQRLALQRRTNCTTKLPLTTPPLFSAFSETGGTSQRAVHVSQYEMRALLATMANYHYTTFSNCCKCARTRAGLKIKCYLELLPTSRPLQFVAMEILDPLPKTTTGSQFTVVITDWYTKRTREIPSSKTTAPHVASTFFDKRIVSYRIPAFFSRTMFRGL